jgi:hypothetical protein
MSWFSKIFQPKSSPTPSTGSNTAEDIIHFYQRLGFFTGVEPASVIQDYTRSHGQPPAAGKPWDDVFLLAYAKGDVWADDPEADVCAENEVYSTVLPEWAAISHGAFAPGTITEQWKSNTGPVALSFQLSGQSVSVSPSYLDDWIDLEVLRQINTLIASSGRQFECAVDGNFALVLCLTQEQRKRMQAERQFPFGW